LANLTSKELTAIDDQLSLEENMVKKFKLYAQTCVDPQLKTKCEQIASRHQSHYTRLLNQLN